MLKTGVKPKKQEHRRRMLGSPIFLSCLCPGSRSHEGQGQIFIVQCEGLGTSVIACDYEQNPTRDDKVMDKVQVFAQKNDVFTAIYVQGQGYMKAKVRSL